jgi:inorganic pyrophosphatase
VKLIGWGDAAEAKRLITEAIARARNSDKSDDKHG